MLINKKIIYDNTGKPIKVILSYEEFQYMEKIIKKAKQNSIPLSNNENLLLSEKSLAKEWLTPEEDKAWKDL